MRVKTISDTLPILEQFQADTKGLETLFYYHHCSLLNHKNIIIVIIPNHLARLETKHVIYTFLSLSVSLRGSTVTHPFITKSCPMSKFGPVTVKTKLDQLRYD